MNKEYIKYGLNLMTEQAMRHVDENGSQPESAIVLLFPEKAPYDKLVAALDAGEFSPCAVTATVFG